MQKLCFAAAALFMLVIAVLVPSPALTESAFFTLYGQFTALAAAFAVLLVHTTRRQALRLGARDWEKDAIEKVPTSLLSACCIGGALVGARALYCLVRYDFYLFEVGIAGVLRIWEGGFLLYGAALGAVLAAVLLAKARGTDAWRLLDEIAAPAMMAVSICRMAEGMTTEGLGTWVENAFFCRFPFAVQNEWGEWQLAVYLFETAAAVVILFYLLRQRRAAAGERFLTALLLYACCQIVLESLRMDACLRIGFVRVSMVLSAVAAFAVTLIRALRVSKKQAAVCGGICFALIAAAGIIEWALDKTPVNNLLLYALMSACCAVIAFVGMRHIRREA